MRLFAYARSFSRAMAHHRVPMMQMSKQASLRIMPSMTPILTNCSMIRNPGFQLSLVSLGLLDSLSDQEDDDESAILPKTTGSLLNQR